MHDITDATREREISSTSWLQTITRFPVEGTTIKNKKQKEGSDTVKWTADRASKHAISRIEPSAREEAAMAAEAYLLRVWPEASDGARGKGIETAAPGVYIYERGAVSKQNPRTSS